MSASGTGVFVGQAAGLGPEFNGAFVRIHPEQVNSFGLA
jgi:hypothetical protein